MFVNSETTWQIHQLNREERLHRALFRASLQWESHPRMAQKSQWQRLQTQISDFVDTLRCRFLAHCPSPVELAPVQLAPCCQEVRP